MLILHPCTATTKRRLTRSACAMAVAFFFLIHSLRIVFSCFHLLSAFCSCYSTATTTYVFDLPMTFPRLLIVTLSTLPTNYLRSTSVTPSKTRIRSPWRIPTAEGSWPLRMRTSSRLRVSSTALGSEVQSFPITLAAFSALFARVALGVWIPLVSVARSGHSASV